MLEGWKGKESAFLLESLQASKLPSIPASRQV
jgi:hypothetical protein